MIKFTGVRTSWLMRARKSLFARLADLIETAETGFSVAWKRTLLEAMEYLKSTQQDVVLLDLGMPELSSLPSFTAIRAIAPDIPVVVLTADDDPFTRRRLLNMGASYYLVKQETDGNEV